ncbi:hypothetical protein MMC19_000027 [Ptychographa xylographoides]|nr:hypothetical protein [Ptychographa xylographoides]
MVQLINNRNDRSTEIAALLACVLFVCIEAMQSNTNQALALFRKGNTLLNSIAEHVGPLDLTQGVSAVLMTDIAPIFRRFGVLSALWGSPVEPLSAWFKPPSEGDLPSVPLSFSTLAEARCGIYDLTDASQGFTMAVFMYRKEVNPDPASEKVLLREQHCILAHLSQWGRKFQALHTRLGTSVSLAEAQMFAIYRMSHMVVTIWVSSALADFETSLDSYSNLFESIVREAAILVESASDLPPTDVASLQHFSFEMSFMPPLYFTALKCRSPSLRRRAVALMKQSSRNEGFWDLAQTARVVERVIELEEVDLLSSSLRDARGDPMPEESRRIRHAFFDEVVLPTGRKQTTLTCVKRAPGPELWETIVEVLDTEIVI